MDGLHVGVEGRDGVSVRRVGWPDHHSHERRVSLLLAST
jgi:hypothetical protein